MAELTKTLDTVNRGKAIVEPDKPGPSLLSAFVGPVSTFFSGADDRARRDAKAATSAIENTVEGAVFNEFKRAADNLQRTKNGAQQGRIPAGQLDISVEKVKEELFNKFPEHKATIAEYMQQRGFDHWEFRELTLAKKAQEDTASAITKAQTDDYDYAFKAGVGHPERTFEENVIAGRKQRALDERLERLKKEYELNNLLAEGKREQFIFDQGQHDREAFGLVNEDLSNKINQFFPQIAKFTAAATGDAEKEKRLAELVPLMGQWVQNERQRAISKLGTAATPELLKMINERYDNLGQSLESIFTGSLSSYKMAEQTMRSMETQFKIKAADSLRIYSELSTVFGREAVNAIFGGDISMAFSPDQIKQITEEIKGYQTGDAQKGRAHIMRLSMLLKGQLNLKDMTEAEAMQMIPQVAKAIEGTQAAILVGDESDSAKTTWANSYGQLVEATVEVQPGQRNLSSLWAGMRFVASPGARTVLDKMISDPTTREQGMALLVGSRGAATHALQTAKMSNMELRPFQSIRFDGTKFVADFDRRGFEKWAAQQKQGGVIPGSARGALYDAGPKQLPVPSEREARILNKGTQDKLSIMNAALDHLVETSKHDPDFKGATPKQIREHLALGKPLFKANGKPVLSSDEQFNREVDKFEEALRTDPLKGSGKSIDITDIKFSSPTDALVRTVMLEAANQGAEGWKAVADTILTRANGDLSRIPEIVLANDGKTWQFEPWGDDKTRRKGLAIDADSKEYQRVLAAILPLLSGDEPRRGFTNFLNKDLVLERGDKIPDWAKGEGTKIGDHTFFSNPRG